SVVSRVALRGFLSRLMGLITATGGPRIVPAAPAQEPALPSAREAMAAAQRSARPTARDVIAQIASLWIPVRGDRLERDDDAVIGGIASIRDTSLVVVALDRKVGLPTLSSVRKATRIARLAGHLDLPLLILVDSPQAVLSQPS